MHEAQEWSTAQQKFRGWPSVLFSESLKLSLFLPNFHLQLLNHVSCGQSFQQVDLRFSAVHARQKKKLRKGRREEFRGQILQEAHTEKSGPNLEISTAANGTLSISNAKSSGLSPPWKPCAFACSSVSTISTPPPNRNPPEVKHPPYHIRSPICHELSDPRSSL